MPKFNPVEPQPGTDEFLKRLELAKKFRAEKVQVYTTPKTGPRLQLREMKKETEMDRSIFGPFPRITKLK